MSYEPISIVSAELSHLNFHDNTNRTNELRLALLNKGLSIVGVKLHEHSATRQAFIVVNSKYSDVLKMAQMFGQNSIIISDKERNTCKVKTEAAGQIIPIGKLCNASKDSTLDTQLYLSFQEDGKEYFFTLKEQN